MSQKTIYKCDRCGKEKEDDHQFLRRLAIERPDAWRATAPKGYIDTPVAVSWCQECYFALGLIKPWSGYPEIPNNPPSPTMEELLREMLREIVREEMPQC